MLSVAKEQAGTALLLLPTMKLGARVKEQIARTIGNFFTTNEILNIFTDANISANRELYAKWHITLDAFSKTSGVDAIFGIIEEFCHPLNFKRNPLRRDDFITALNADLAYDDLEIQSTERTAKVCSVGDSDIPKDAEVPKENKPATTTLSPKEVEEVFDDLELYDNDTEIPTEDDVKEAEDVRKIAENKEAIRQLRDFHQMLIDVVETFCQNLKKPNKELNDSYLFLMRKIQDIVQKLNLQYHTLTLYRPFKDIYSAEIEWNGAGDGLEIRLNPKLSWDAVRPSLYKAHSDIVKICAIAEEDSEMTDDQKKLEEIAGLVAKARVEKASKSDKQRKALPIEIINPIHITREVHGRTSKPLVQRKATDLKVELSAGYLEAFDDGSIRYKGTPIEMRNQLKDLCRLFMGKPNRLVTIDRITEELIRADKRKTTSHTTISKYVSELRAILMSHFKREVFINQKEEGWFFRP